MGKKLKVLSLALFIVCAFGAASAGSAQAAVPEFTVSGGTSGAHEALAEETTVTPAGGDFTLTETNFLRITCTALKLDEGFIIDNGSEGTIKSLTFFGCSVRTTTGGTTTCLVQGGTPERNGEIHTNAVKLTLKTVGTKHVVTFEPDSGEVFVQLKITECALEGTTNVTGTIGTEALTASGTLATNQELESSQATSEAGGDAVRFGTRTAWLDGKVDLHLASDRNWGVDW